MTRVLVLVFFREKERLLVGENACHVRVLLEQHVYWGEWYNKMKKIDRYLLLDTYLTSGW